MNVQQRQAIEKKIVTFLVDKALTFGFSVTVFDGEEHPVRESKDMTLILDNLFACDEEWLQFYDAGHKIVGVVSLVYGNDGYDVIADHTVNAMTDKVMAEVDQYIEHLEKGGVR